jgi:segregation and condensation protein A
MDEVGNDQIGSHSDTDVSVETSAVIIENPTADNHEFAKVADESDESDIDLKEEDNTDSEIVHAQSLNSKDVISAIANDNVFTVRIEEFEGPIDLLLHLVKRNELAIEKISLALISQQYLDCLKDLTAIDLELASEYLVIAATLLSIKSSLILNEPVELIADEEGNLIDPHDLLLQRLKEAEIYKEGAAFLECRNELGYDIFATNQSLKHLPDVDAPLKQHDAMLLGKAFKRLLSEMEGGKLLYHITMESVSVAETMAYILNIFEVKKVKFINGKEQKAFLFEDFLVKNYNKAQLIGTFIAMLELCKRQAIMVYQEQDRILVSMAAENIDLKNLSSEFDQEQQDNNNLDQENVSENQFTESDANPKVAVGEAH